MLAQAISVVQCAVQLVFQLHINALLAFAILTHTRLSLQLRDHLIAYGFFACRVKRLVGIAKVQQQPDYKTRGGGDGNQGRLAILGALNGCSKGGVFVAVKNTIHSIVSITLPGIFFI